MPHFCKALVPVCFLLLAGCGSVVHERARFEGDRVSNSSFGRGVYYQLPAGYAVLNPRSPVPPKAENAEFERFLRVLAASNDAPGNSAFRECILLRAEDRYLVLVHISVNLPGTFKRMHPARRQLLLPDIATFVHRRLDVPQRDFHYSIGERGGRTAIAYAPFQPDKAGAPAAEWRGLGYTILGDVTDVTHVLAFSRESNLAAARADLEFLMTRFSYGKPLAP